MSRTVAETRWWDFLDKCSPGCSLCWGGRPLWGGGEVVLGPWNLLSFPFCLLHFIMLTLPCRWVLLLSSGFLGCVTSILLVLGTGLYLEGLNCGADSVTWKAPCYLVQNMLPMVTNWFGVRQVAITLMKEMMLLRQQLRQRPGKKDLTAEKPRKTSRAVSMTGLTGREHLLSLDIRTPFLSKQWGHKDCLFDTLFWNNFKLWRILSPIQAAP